MNAISLIIVFIFCTAGAVLALAGFPGALFAWAGIFLAALMDGFRSIGPGFLLLLFAAALAGEFLDFFSGVAGARRRGASGKGLRGALFGGMTGALLMSLIFPGAGTLAGAALGTFAGAFAGEMLSGRGLKAASRSGIGAVMGRAVGSALKILVIITSGLAAAAAYIGLL